jgi:hypothetical protein
VPKWHIGKVEMNTLHQHIRAYNGTKIAVFNDGSIVSDTPQRRWLTEWKLLGKVLNEPKFAQRIDIGSLHVSF